MMQHAQMLKSVAALTDNGLRWDSLGAIEESAKHGIPLHKEIWNEWKTKLPSMNTVLGIPARWR